MKADRQRQITELIRRRPITSQAELARILRELGQRVTQATLSRDLVELGAYKVRANGGSPVYRLPEDPAELGGGWLRRMLREFATDISASGNLALVRTPPGGAAAVARAIDGASLPEILGTVAGDDTIIIVSRSERGGAKLARSLRALAHFQDIKEA